MAFQGFGKVQVGADVRYRFRTIKAVPYPRRLPHIHYKVKLGNRELLTTQMYIAGECTNSRDASARMLGAEQRGLLQARIEAYSDLPLTQAPWGRKSFALIAVSGLLPGALAYWAHGPARKALGAARTAMALYQGPLYGALLGWAMLGESVRAFQAVGLALILPGLYLASQSGAVARDDLKT